MTRYEIIRGRGGNSVAHIAKKFSSSPSVIFDVMLQCVRDGLDLDANNINDDALDRSLVKLSNKYNSPIIMGDYRRAQLLRITQNHKKVYSLSNIPNKTVKVIIYYDIDEFPNVLRPILRVRRNIL